MPTVDIKDWNNKKVGSLELSDEIFGYPYKEHLIHEAVRNYLASLRQGTHKVKNRSEVSGSGKKPFRQKGTGRARQGGGRPPIHRHGGTVHGPVPRSYAHDVSVGQKKNALKAVLSRRASEERIVVLDRMELESHRTRELRDAVGVLGIQGKALFVDSRDNANLLRASRNVSTWKIVDPLAVNAHDVLAHPTLVVSKQALARVVENLGGE
jgi:large subunit ribosomal protein L4